MANKFTLKGQGVEISYAIGGNPTFTALTYKEGDVTKDFKSSEISTDATVIDKLVTIVLERSIDFGATTFSFLLTHTPNRPPHTVERAASDARHSSRRSWNHIMRPDY
jgi:hypothetical protein